MTDQNAPYSGPDAQSAPRFIEQASAASTPTVTPQQGIGPYTIREWIVIGAAVLLLLLSFFSRAQSSTFIGYSPVWTLGIAWLPAVVLPVIAAALIAVRRTNSVRNFGSLSIDQFASVTFVGATITWIHIAVTLGSLASWVTWVAIVVSLAGVFFTIFARFVAPFSDDFTGREEVPAHAAARPARPVIQAPRPAAPTASHQPAAQTAAFGAPASQQHDPFRAPEHTDPFASTATGGIDRFAPPSMERADATPTATADPSAAEADGTSAPEASAASAADTDASTAVDGEATTAEPPLAEPASDDALSGRDEAVAQPEPRAEATHAEVTHAEATHAETAAQAAAGQQPFWALVPEERDVHDFEGRPIYKIGPTAWALVLEDRGTYFVMRHDDGRIGYLHNVAGVTRG
ncbi:hypothetical protein GCM10010910_06860 [Microbacterium nanhaiense]|uniref:DUF2637 domain-containing protein n=1 Tax=Microbacterium nanhaiense TaxID=1301026 RepID=A0ABQ2MXF3_9MICO|nr:hypothetical protein [Microbacterium nanhaiense]GGO60729.1 hypothetical protein GCM10010910_06860 [Microbacterium nanhaiense]